MPVDVEEVFSELVRLETQLWSAADARLRSAHDLPLSWFEPLRVVQDTPGCRLSDIVDALGITVGGASKLVDRLQAAGLCERAIDPSDRRSSLIALTPAGTRVVDAAHVTFRRELGSLLLGQVDEDSLVDLLSTVGRLRSQFDDPPRPVE
jgi:DNA-binding MarR family transcriptional regulator